MADIFISYAREDAAAVETLASALETRGYSVWWDKHLAAGTRYLAETEEKLKSAKAVIVVWTKVSIQSHWVADEAGVGRDAGTLVPVTLDGSMPPLGFRQFQVMDLSGWRGADGPHLQRLDDALARLIPRESRAEPSPAGPAPPPKRRFMLAAVAALAVIALGLGAGTVWLLARNAGDAWLENKAIPQIEAHLVSGDSEAAYALTKEAQRRFPDAKEVGEFWPRIAWQTTITSEPAGAKVFRRAYDAPASAEWEELGVTPLENVRIPYGYSRLRFEKEGYAPLLRAIGGGGRSMQLLPPDFDQLHPFLIGAGAFRLEPLDSAHKDKVRVSGWMQPIDGKPAAFKDFFLDRTEVTNAKFREFVEAGGYRKAELWDPVQKDGKPIPFDEAMKLFVDTTGRPGPAGWVGGDYPEGRDAFPVTGVSWYEAMAYARFRGEQLPTAYHWDRGTAPAEIPWLLQAGNFSSDGPRAVGEGDAMSYVGALDMLGNAREWTASAMGDQRIVRGGGWTDPQYCLACLAPPLDRSATNGFRLAVIEDDPEVASLAQAPIAAPVYPPWRQPVSDEVFEAYARQFDYEHTPLNPTVDATSTTRSWTRERVSFDAPDGERMMLDLYLPTNGSPPYQLVLNWPDIAAFQLPSAEAYANELDFVVKSGRAVALPILWGTFERGGGSRGMTASGSIAERDKLVHMVKETRRALDYLETREDIDADAIGLYGFSWGAVFGMNVLAREPRIRVAVLNLGGVPPVPPLPEIDPLNSATRIKSAVLLFNGAYDSVIPAQIGDHLFDMLKLPADQKRHIVGAGSHYMPRDVLVRETLDWLDKHLGPVRQGAS